MQSEGEREREGGRRGEGRASSLGLAGTGSGPQKEGGGRLPVCAGGGAVCGGVLLVILSFFLVRVFGGGAYGIPPTVPLLPWLLEQQTDRPTDR